MTREELSAAVDSYFANHLDKEYWTGLTGVVKSASIEMATGDILAELSIKIDHVVSGSSAFKAIAEQAVYLARHYSELSEGWLPTQESVEGVSVGYKYLGEGNGISHRAEAYIKAAKKEALKGTVRVTRG
jgi:hypothetical protein